MADKIKIDQVITLDGCIGPAAGCIFAEILADGSHSNIEMSYHCGMMNERIPWPRMKEVNQKFPDFCPLNNGNIIIQKKDE